MSKRTKEAAHVANNAVIAIAKDAAKRYGVHLVLAVATPHNRNDDKGRPMMMMGVDAHTSQPVALQLAALALGSLSLPTTELDDDERCAFVEKMLVLGAERADDLWDRNTIGRGNTKPKSEGT